MDSFDLEARKSALYPGGNEEPLKVSEPGQERSDLHFRLIIWRRSGGEKAMEATSFHEQKLIPHGLTGELTSHFFLKFIYFN